MSQTAEEKARRAKVILRSGIAQVPTARCEGDFTTCVCDAVQQYLEDYRTWDNDRAIFADVSSVWSEAEDDASYPSVAVTTAGKVTEDPEGGYTPAFDGDQTFVIDGKECSVAQVALCTIPLALEVYCTSPEQRSNVMMWLERALNPSMETGGLILEIPAYYGVRVTFSSNDVSFLDTASNAKRRYRLARALLTGTGPKVVPFPMRRVTYGQRRVVDDEDLG